MYYFKMKVVSFDVGIKNLAYCILEYTDTATKYKIHGWGIIDLLQNETYRCCENNGKGLPCTVPAKFTDKESNYYCGRHLRRAKNKTKKIKFKKASQEPLDLLGAEMFSAFNELPEMLDVDAVVIENQPVLKNPKMKSIQMMIYSYFLFYGKCADSSPIKTLSLFSASKKLDVYKGESVECALEDKYAQRKYLSIEYTKRMVVEQPVFLDVMLESKKKDDLADAYMQGCYYLMRACEEKKAVLTRSKKRQ